MKKLLLGCAGLALFASVMSVMLWRDLRTERELSAALQSRLAEAEARTTPAVLPAATARPAAATAATTAPINTSRSEPNIIQPLPAAQNAQTFVPNVGVTQRDLLKDPEYRRARLAQLRMSLPETNPGLAEELGLSPEQADRLFDLLAENQLEMSTNIGVALRPNGEIDQALVQEMQRQRQELQTKHEATLAAMLGDARMSKLQDYQQTLGSRQRVLQLGRTLGAQGQPLANAQIGPLAEVMAAEQKRQQQDQQAMQRELRAGPQQGPGSQMDPQTQARLLEENFRRQAESNRRLIDAMAPHLTARQLELYRSQLDNQLTVNRISSRLQREAAQNRQAVPVNIATAVPPPPPP